MRVSAARDQKKGDPGEDEADSKKTCSHDFRAACANPAPEDAGYQEAEEGQKDDQIVHWGPVSALQRIDVFNRDRSPIAEIGDEDGEPDRSLGRSDGQDE